MFDWASVIWASHLALQVTLDKGLNKHKLVCLLTSTQACVDDQILSLHRGKLQRR